MATQLRLVEAPATPATPSAARAPARPRRAERARRARRTVHWSDWRLDDRARHVGRQGVAQARAALQRSQRPDPTAPLSKAS
ncbi:MAG: hypothetical protein M3046_06570 [Actinomycetota bacterium]|nr:hypothetical protein [Actinomycetota bacterium]